MEPLISIIVPVFNVSKYLDKCVDSLINQTYNNIEILLIDDGSTDDSGQKCDNFKSLDSRVKVFHKNNGGQGSARNVGLDSCNGDFIFFVDSDDSIDKDCLEFLYQLINETEADVACCNFRYIDETGKTIKNRKLDTSIIEFDSISSIKSLWYQGPLNIAPWGKLFRKYCWEGIRFKECYSEDFATMHYVYKNLRKIVFSSSEKLNYLVRKDSSVRSFKKEKLAMIGICNDIQSFARDNKELESAANHKTISVMFHLLFQIKDKQMYKDEVACVKKMIKTLRPSVRKDKMCTSKVKLGILLSYFGFWLPKLVFSILSKKRVVA